MGITITLNGQTRHFETLHPISTLADIITALGLKADRIAIEQNGTIAPRTTWPTTHVTSGDRLEVVHFVGGGAFD
jgi:sulfur carrier protein